MTSEAPLGRSYDVQGVDASPGSWPVGMIGLWSYELSRLPTNFAVCDGTRGTPDMRGLFPLGVDASHALATSGGSSTLAAHTHAFTQPDNHTFTQPTAHVVTDPAYTPSDEHVISQPVFAAPAAHGAHGGTPAEFLATPGSGIWINTYNSSANATAGLAHSSNNHVAGAITTVVTLTNNVGGHAPNPITKSSSGSLTHNHDGGAVNAHANGAVGAVSGTVTGLQPYRALYFVMRVS